MFAQDMPAFHCSRQRGSYFCVDCIVDSNLVLVKYPGVARVHKLAGAEQVVFKTSDHMHFICWRAQVYRYQLDFCCWIKPSACVPENFAESDARADEGVVLNLKTPASSVGILGTNW